MEENKIKQLLKEILQKENVDLSENQRYHSLHSNMISDLSEEEWEEMKKNKAKELNAYFNEKRNTWHIALSLGYDENHKRIRKVLTGNSKEDVYQKYFEFKNNNKVLEEEKANETNDRAQIFFKDYINYVLDINKSTIRESSLKATKDNAKYIIKAIGAYKMCELSKEIIVKYINDFVGEKYTKGNVQDYYSKEIVTKVYQILKRCIEQAYKEKVIPVNYMEDIPKPKSKQRNKNQKNKPLEDDKIIEISKALKDERMLSIFFRIMLETGARPSEVLGLNFTDINQENGEISINKTLTFDVKEVQKDNRTIAYKTPKIGDVKNYRDGNNPFAHRRFVLDDTLLNDIKQYEIGIKKNEKVMELRKSNDTVENMFTGTKQQLFNYQAFSKRFKKHLEKNGVDFSGYTLYGIRHTFATNLLKNKVDLKTVQMLLGDTGSEMVLRVYTNIDKEHTLKHSELYSNKCKKMFG